MRTKGAITKRDEYFPVDSMKLKIFNIFFSKTIWLEKFNLKWKHHQEVYIQVALIMTPWIHGAQ